MYSARLLGGFSVHMKSATRSRWFATRRYSRYISPLSDRLVKWVMRRWLIRSSSRPDAGKKQRWISSRAIQVDDLVDFNLVASCTSALTTLNELLTFGTEVGIGYIHWFGGGTEIIYGGIRGWGVRPVDHSVCLDPRRNVPTSMAVSCFELRHPTLLISSVSVSIFHHAWLAG